MLCREELSVVYRGTECYIERNFVLYRDGLSIV